MKKVGILVIGLGASLLGFYLYNQFAIAKSFTYSISGISFSKVSDGVIQFLVGFVINNKSIFSVTITGVNIIAYLYGSPIGNIQNNLDIIIPANGQGQAQVYINIEEKNLVANGINILANAGNLQNITLQLRGHISVKTFFGSVNVPVNYDTKAANYLSLI